MEDEECYHTDFVNILDQEYVDLGTLQLTVECSDCGAQGHRTIDLVTTEGVDWDAD